MKRIIVSGGGTGGHIYPALTIAREILAVEDAEILFVGTARGMESRIVPAEGFRFASLPAAGIQRKLTLSNVKSLGKAALGMWRAREILKTFHPDVVIGTGGYVCGPILMAAALAHIPTMIQEQNVIPGITNKILSRVVNRVALGYEEAQSRFPHPEKCVYTGNPVRRDVLTANRDDSREKLGISSDTFMVLVAGGSRGARSINTAMLGVHRYFRDAEKLCLWHVTGTDGFEDVKAKLGNVSETGAWGRASRIVRYQNDMPTALAAADLVVYRAGAVGLAELAARGLPSVLIPFPYAAEDHQTYNARAFADHGAADMIADKELTDEKLIHLIENLRNNPDALREMAAAALSLGKPQAGETIARMALELAEEGGVS